MIKTSARSVAQRPNPVRLGPSTVSRIGWQDPFSHVESAAADQVIPTGHARSIAENPPAKLSGYDQVFPAGLRRGTLVLLHSSVPACANPVIFPVSHFEICGYSEEAQRFLATTDLN